MAPERPAGTVPPDRESEQEARLEEILAGYIERLNRGEEIDSDEVLARYPDVAGDLLDHLHCFLDFQPAPAEEPLGTVGDYQLRRRIGRGGMGVVYEAWEGSMDRRVALKVLPPGVAADPKAGARFLREAQTAGKLSHPNVVPVYFTGVKDQTPFYVMEFVEGATLGQMLSRLRDAAPETETPFGPKDQADYFVRIARAFAGAADGLQHAHSKGVIHRDIKPSNLILDRGAGQGEGVDGSLRILDFGLARLEGQEGQTGSGDLVGTVLYMSPEQAARSKIPLDRRTDIYSLGAALYELIALRPPFRGKDPEDTLSQIIERDPIEPRKLNPRIPEDLETIVLECLRKKPADRYGTAEALAQDLRRFVRGDPVEARPESTWEKLFRRVRRDRRAILAAGVLAVLLGALGWLAWSNANAEREKARLLHDATVREAAIELSSGQLTLLGRDIDSLGSVLFLFQTRDFRRGAAGVEDTLRKLEQAAEAVPERPDAPYYLARLYRLSGDEEAAGREAARALERDRDFVPAEVLVREIALDRGPLSESDIQPILDRFRDRNRWQEPWLLAYEHVRRRAWPEAVAAYGQLLRFRNAEPYVGFAVEAWMGRGIARLWANEFHGATSDFAAAWGIWPGLGEAGFALAVAWHRAGQAAEAERVFLELHSESPEGSKSEIAGWILGVYERAGDRAKADEWLERIDGWARDAVDCMHFFWQSRHEEWMEKSQKMLDARPDDVYALTSLGWAKMFNQWGRRGPFWDSERREILELARKAYALYPNYRHSRLLLAEALQVNGRPEEALRTIEEAIRFRMRTGGEDCTDLVVHGVILYLQGKLEEAERVLLEALDRQPGNATFLNDLAIAHELRGRYEEAAGEFRAVIERGFASANQYGHLARVLNRLGRYDEAIGAAEEALRRLPKNTSAYEDLAFALWKRGRTEEALEAAEAGILELPGREHLHLVKGRILEDLGKSEEAATACSRELLDLRLEDPEAHEALGGLLRKRPELAAIPEVAAVGEAIERKRSAGSCEAILLETLALIRSPRREEASGAAQDPGK